MMKRLTIGLDARTVAELRAIAASRQASLSALLREELSKIVAEHRSFERARRRALRRLEANLVLVL
jgi:hypothetical protein